MPSRAIRSAAATALSVVAFVALAALPANAEPAPSLSLCTPVTATPVPTVPPPSGTPTDSSDEPLCPVGVLEGTVTDLGGGLATVYLEDPVSHAQYVTTTDSKGYWRVEVRPGSYLVRYHLFNQVQWAYGRTTSASANLITVGGDETVQVDEQLLPSGVLYVNATDATTGQPLQGFCLTVDGAFLQAKDCSDSGVGAISLLGEGVYTVTITSDTHLRTVVRGVKVTRGEKSFLDVKVAAAATIVATVVDARTGAPVSGANVTAFAALHPEGTVVNETPTASSDSGGVATLTDVTPDSYRLFVKPSDGVHGAQWVGGSGGTGAVDEATVFTPRAGETVRVTVKMDGVGSITGVVTDRTTGQPLANAQVEAGYTYGIADETGRYTITGLGPYRWPLHFKFDGYASEWSGGGPDRSEARAVRVRAGAAAEYDFALGRGIAVTGTFTSPAGQLPQFGLVQAFNPETSVYLGFALVDASGHYTLRVLPGQPLRLLTIAVFNSGHVLRWYPDRYNYTDAESVPIPARAKELRLDLQITPA